MTETCISNSFVPQHDNTRLLRNAFGQFATGVTAVTCASADGPIAITANSFSSLSLDPALVMWSPAKASRRFKYFEAAEEFAIHVLDENQKGFCEIITKDMNALDQIDHETSASGVPLLAGCLARFQCTQAATHDAGDHVIIIGSVNLVDTNVGSALTFFAGEFGNLTSG